MSKDFKGLERKICPAKGINTERDEMKMRIFDRIREIDQKYSTMQSNTVKKTV